MHVFSFLLTDIELEKVNTWTKDLLSSLESGGKSIATRQLDEADAVAGSPKAKKKQQKVVAQAATMSHFA